MLRIRALMCSRLVQAEPIRLNPGCRNFYKPKWAQVTPEDRDYIHKSIIPTDHFQKSLPHLPIPKLEDTLDRYMEAQLPIQTAEEHDASVKAVQHFHSHEGRELHRALVALDEQNKNTSYITEPWFDMYLKDRRSVALYHNPFITFTDDPNPKYMNQLVRATNIVVSSLRFMKTFRANWLEPDIYHLDPKTSDNIKFRVFCSWLSKSISFYGAYWWKAFPLDMSQYHSLFNSTRIPKHGKDELFTDESAKHMLVIRNGHMYIFDAIDRDGCIVSPEVIMSHIKYILEDQRPPNEHALGVLTTADRNKWATIRSQLCSAGVSNAGYMKLVDSALFALILDDHIPADPNDMTRTYLHGDGTSRWFDKSFSVILTKDGRAAVNFEHAWGDGVAILRYFNEIWKETTNKPFVHPDTPPANVDSSKTVQHLEFALDPKLKEYIRECKDDFASRCASLDMDHLEYHTFTKKLIKEKKFSPDAIMQFVIQLAYFRQYGKTVATYESCSTAAFKKGRTETVRSATMATKKACEMFMKSGTPYSADALMLALDDCSKIHSKLTKEAATGQGFDRHLFAMKHLAEKHGKVPDFYSEPGYIKLNHIILSTSTLTSPAVVIGGFGPVTPNGYGVGYGVEDDRLGFNVTNYPASGTNVHEFKDCLRESLDDLYSVFNGINPRSS